MIIGKFIERFKRGTLHWIKMYTTENDVTSKLTKLDVNKNTEKNGTNLY